MSIVKLLKKKLNRTFFTTPSHNQKNYFSKEYKNFYKDDISELDGYDNLSDPKGEILLAQIKASKIYNTQKTFFITQGATTAILSAMKAIIRPMDKILVARNCHKSVFNGLILTAADVDWFMPDCDEDWGIYTKIDTKKLESTLKLNDYKAFILTSPTYEGLNSDIEKISNICKQNNTYLIVDEAHGSLYNFSDYLPKTAIEQGADIAINSLHKTAGALNQTALLHISKDIRNISQESFQNAINLFQTSSPSYPLLKNIEECIIYLNSDKGREEINRLIINISKFKEELKNYNIEFYEDNCHDATKILLRKKGMSGIELSEKLYEEFDIEDEMNNENSCLYLTGIGTTKLKLSTLKSALINVQPENKNSNFEFKKLDFQPFPLIKIKPWEAFNRKTEIVDKNNSLLKISSKAIIPYPPGIGLIYPGEAIQQWHLDYLEENVEILQ